MALGDAGGDRLGLRADEPAQLEDEGGPRLGAERFMHHGEDGSRVRVMTPHPLPGDPDTAAAAVSDPPTSFSNRFCTARSATVRQPRPNRPTRLLTAFRGPAAPESR
ncbi:hypothetical protein GCM10010339_91130 [Streptomyces alanosinicus]|uniref:Uncharacterized protein n=1 Tax=Streptomyces alanosinicus TaxID=68171 RepID=A0A918YUD7_9ACTN|nr:hypothetical protein GCM10010339_91130 [Streptomyces alanosinicus]